MNITFLIGNGFDLNLGLKTGYRDFYPYYIKRNPDDLIAKSISSKYDKWADLELGLGNYVESISDDGIGSFFDSKEKLEHDLAEYLIEEEKRLEWNSISEIGKVFRSKLLNFHADFNDQEKNTYHEMVAKCTQSIHYTFITFNYTSVLDKIVEELQRTAPISSHLASDGKHNDFIDFPLHIHGTFSTGLIIGVDNALQIKNETIINNNAYLNYLTKVALNTTLGENRIQKAKQIIDKSRYVCLYGISIGETDEYWWSYLIEWLSRDEKNRVVLFTYDKNNGFVSAAQKVRKRDEWRSIFLKRGKCTDDSIIENIQDRIIVISNSDIFTLKALKVKEYATS